MNDGRNYEKPEETEETVDEKERAALESFIEALMDGAISAGPGQEPRENCDYVNLHAELTFEQTKKVEKSLVRIYERSGGAGAQALAAMREDDSLVFNYDIEAENLRTVNDTLEDILHVRDAGVGIQVDLTKLDMFRALTLSIIDKLDKFGPVV